MSISYLKFPSRLLTMNKCKRNFVSKVSEDIVVLIAFFIPDRTTLFEYLYALRPANVLGPLEIVWQLHLVGCCRQRLWPRLDLSRHCATCQSRMESVAKFYPAVIADIGCDLARLQCLLDPKASIHCSVSTKEASCNDLIRLEAWKDIRVTEIELWNFHPAQHLDFLSYFQHLTMLKWHECNPAPMIFKFAAKSKSLHSLDLKTFTQGAPGHCSISSAMSTDLLTWINSHAVESLGLELFSWEFTADFLRVVQAVLRRPTLRMFRFFTPRIVSLTCFATYCRVRRELSLSFLGWSTSLHQNSHFATEELIDLVCAYDVAIRANLRTFRLCGLPPGQFQPVWKTVAIRLSPFHVENLILESNNMTDDDAIALAKDLGRFPNLKSLGLLHNPFGDENAKAIVSAASSSLRNVAISNKK
ncbi:hypothetical protein AeMF1_006635 [Aphanomyces euteiches]|nr:hypothetical protein AeMF1_006635 [Aphanomyces euteiches]